MSNIPIYDIRHGYSFQANQAATVKCYDDSSQINYLYFCPINSDKAMSTDEEAQQDEMLAMESIFEGDTFQLHPGEILSGQIKIRLELPDPFYVTVETEGELRDENLLTIPGVAERNETKYRVQFLPPLMLHFTLPKNYPSQTKPNFTLSAQWLHRASVSTK